MKKIYLIHRWDGNPDSDWYPWLKKELQNKGFEIIIPEMPDTAEPKIDKWVSELKDVIKTVDEDTYFIGHSIGCQTIMRYLEKLPEKNKIAGAIFVAGWFKLANLEGAEVEEIAKPWLETPINLDNLNHKIKKLIVILSDNEPYDFIKENSEIFKEKLNAKIIIEKQKGHFTEDDGVTKLPIVLNKLLEMLK
ncbi:MAG: alpha/beta hydrolase [Nanoarchaeota archaeon]